MMNKTEIGNDGQRRCQWCMATPAYQAYHDTEWGFPVADDRHLFEKICLESFQSGLSWRTILTKRENFRMAFQNFNFNKVAAFSQHDVERLLQDKGIVRHQGKIQAVINNARCAQNMVQQYGSLAAFFWQYRTQSTGETIVATSTESVALAKALKKLGWQFVGATTVYAFMQSMGMVNDHAPDCAIRDQVEQALTTFSIPT